MNCCITSSEWSHRNSKALVTVEHQWWNHKCLGVPPCPLPPQLPLESSECSSRSSGMFLSGLTFVPLLTLVLSSQRQEIKLKRTPPLGHRAKLLFRLCKFKGFSPSQPSLPLHPDLHTFPTLGKGRKFSLWFFFVTTCWGRVINGENPMWEHAFYVHSQYLL